MAFRVALMTRLKEMRRSLIHKSSSMTTLQITDIFLLNLLFSLQVHVSTFLTPWTAAS